MRVFAGPNGSGKSTIINEIKNYKVNNVPVDFGIYINADLIAKELSSGKCSLKKYQVNLDDTEFRAISNASGLVGNEFDQAAFYKYFHLDKNYIQCLQPDLAEQLAQIVAHVLR